ncbi:methyl-CpG-binding domain-containing protein 13-like isoform X2 [Populus alba x Populus x berolinensis]|nr:methyl-CpG-binding domain-containing protein 13-like isoform X2 [Populus alba x Populus x berolinensis]
MGDPKSDDWLPEGWRVEVKVRHNGKKDKFYFPPSGGCRFNSKIEVSRYLNGSHPHSEQKARSNDRRHSNEVVIEKTLPEGLPLGWTKEIKVTKKGGRIRRDPLYTDPVSGYVLRSMKNACRYIESGVGGRLAFKRNNKENHDVELEDDKTFSPAVAEKEGSEVHEKQNAVIGDQSLKSCEIAKDDQILTSVSTGECITGSEHTSDQFMSVAKRQNVEVNRIPSPIVSDQSPKSFEIATLNSASAGECTTVSDHASDQCVSIAKQQKLEVDGTSSQIVSDQTLKSCEIAKDEQVLDSASTGECTAISKHTSDQFVSVIKKQKLAVNTTPSSIISDQSLKSCEIVKDEQILNSASAGECTILSKHTSGGVGTESSSSEFLEDKGSNQTEEKSDSVKAEDPLQAVLQDKPSVEVGETKKESKKTGVGKSRKKTDLNLPRRASKRLAGIPLAPTPELKAATRARRAALEPSNEIVASTSEQASCGDPDTELNTKHAFDTSKSTEIPVDSNESKHAIVDVEHAGKAGSGKQGDKKHQYDVASPPGNLANGEHAGKIETYSTGDEKQGLPFDLPLEELWQDPCIAFAIKTLTGTSVDDSDSIKVSPGSSNNEFVGMATLDKHAGKEDIGNNGNLSILEEHARAVGTSNNADEKPVSPLVLPFADAWSDPCIEFAIKTLTGALPLDFDMVQDHLLPQVSSSQQQESRGFTLPIGGEFRQTEFWCQQFSTSEKPSFNQAALVGAALPHTKHVNLGYAAAAGPSRCLHSEERSNKRRR